MKMFRVKLVSLEKIGEAAVITLQIVFEDFFYGCVSFPRYSQKKKIIGIEWKTTPSLVFPDSLKNSTIEFEFSLEEGGSLRAFHQIQETKLLFLLIWRGGFLKLTTDDSVDGEEILYPVAQTSPDQSSPDQINIGLIIEESIPVNLPQMVDTAMV